MEHKILLIVGRNGTVELEREVNNENGWWRDILLGLTILTGTTLNLILMIGLAGEKRRTYFNGLIAALCVASSLDSLLSQTSSLLFLLVFPQTACRFSVVTSTFPLILQVYYISVIAISLLPKKLLPLPPPYYIIGPLVVSIMLALPLIFASRSIVVRHYSNRNTCGITGDNLFYSITLISLGFGLPCAAMCYYVIVTKSSACFYLLFQPDSTDIKQAKYVSLLLIAFAVFLLPFIISSCVSSVTPINRLSTFQDSTNSTVIFTGLYDNVFTWTRLQFNVISPILALSVFKNIRKTILHILCFSRNGTVEDENSPEMTAIFTIKQSKRTESYGQSTPVVFGTSSGLMLRTLDLSSESFKYKVSYCDHLDTRVQSSPGCASEPFEGGVNLGNRKTVRFARSIKEIPSTEQEWIEFSPEMSNQKQ